ncbi:lytic polysaccharide monooxygenase [Actinomadura madurae]
MIYPASRNYGCWDRWDDGNPKAAPPGGQLCSGGQTEGGRHRPMDAVGP